MDLTESSIGLEATRCNRTGYTTPGPGLLFTAWARQHLGTNWSVSVTLKHDHALVHAGPYAWVHRPIYSGALPARPMPS